MEQNKNWLPSNLIQILDGPSKFDLMLSLFEGKKVEVTLASPVDGGVPTKYLAVFYSVQNGAQASGIFCGKVTLFREEDHSNKAEDVYEEYFRKERKPQNVFEKYFDSLNTVDRHFLYSSKTRKGHLESSNFSQQ